MSIIKSRTGNNPLRRLLKGKGPLKDSSLKTVHRSKKGEDEGVIKLRVPSYLKKETKAMDRRRREQEQSGHRKFAKVHAKYHSIEENPSQGLEEGFENNILKHPWLGDNQLWDGTDANVNPPPSHADPEARRKFDNKRREQEQDKQLRLGLGYQPGAPKPRPGSR